MWNAPSACAFHNEDIGLRLGCINHTVLSVENIHADGCKVAGWAANLVDPDYSLIDNTVATIQSCIRVPLIANIPWLSDPNPETLAGAIDLAQLNRL